MRIGIAAADITPKAGTHLAGSGAGEHRPARMALDPLHARALVAESGGTMLCIIALDVTIVTSDWTARIRDAVSAQHGIAVEAIMVHAIQTHSAPALGHFMFDPDFPALPPEIEYLRGSEASYAAWVTGRVVAAVGLAIADLEPVQVGSASAVRDDLAFNRRAITRDGRACMPWMFSHRDLPLGPSHIRFIEGPIDPEVGVFAARRDDLSLKAVLLHHTCHPVNVFATQYYAVSADWPGAWCESVGRQTGAIDRAIVLNGCCGNINPWPAFQADFRPDHRRMGAALADSAMAVLPRIEFRPADEVNWCLDHVSIPLKPADADRLAGARRTLDEHPEPRWLDETPPRIDPVWFQAASIESVELMRRRGPCIDYEVQAFRLGDLAIVGFPGEPFVEGQLDLKLRSPSPQTFVAHCCTQYVGYLPTREAFAHGGHEVDFSYWAKLAPEALDLAVDKALELLRGLFA